MSSHLIHYRKAKRVDAVNNFRRIEQMVPDDLLKYGGITVFNLSLYFVLIQFSQILLLKDC